MHLGVVAESFERRTELTVQVIRGVAADIEVGALQWAIGAKGGDDDMAAGTHSMPHLIHITAAIGGVHQKMEHRPVVPHIKTGLRQGHGGHIADAPVHQPVLNPVRLKTRLLQPGHNGLAQQTVIFNNQDMHQSSYALPATGAEIGSHNAGSLP